MPPLIFHGSMGRPCAVEACSSYSVPGTYPVLAQSAIVKYYSLGSFKQQK